VNRGRFAREIADVGRVRDARPDDHAAARRFLTAMPASNDDNHRVVSFPSAKVRKAAWTQRGDPNLILSLAKFERNDRSDNHRRRLIMNALAFVVLVGLMAIGLWLTATINY
jgi:hypothetical protein